MTELEAAVRAFLDAHDSEATYAAVQRMRQCIEAADQRMKLGLDAQSTSTTEAT